MSEKTFATVKHTTEVASHFTNLQFIMLMEHSFPKPTYMLPGNIVILHGKSRKIGQLNWFLISKKQVLESKVNKNNIPAVQKSLISLCQ